jgi:biopolymer transport protein ExbB
MQRIKTNPDKFLGKFIDSINQNGGDKEKTIEAMIPMCQKKGGIFAELILTAFGKFKYGTSKHMSPIELKEWMTDAVEKQANVELPALDAHLTVLAVISNVATLMGLFGTVVGMIESFTAMANSPGGVKADEMAGGIAIALVATAGGLVVAVPSLILYNLLKGYIENYVTEIEAAITKVVDVLAE